MVKVSGKLLVLSSYTMENGFLAVPIINAIDFIFLGDGKADMCECVCPCISRNSTHTENILYEQSFNEFLNKNQTCKVI